MHIISNQKFSNFRKNVSFTIYNNNSFEVAYINNDSKSNNNSKDLLIMNNISDKLDNKLDNKFNNKYYNKYYNKCNCIIF